VEHCERVQIIVPCARICIANCRECLFNLGVNERPLVIGDNHNLQVAPFNTYYSKLEAHLAQVGVDSTVNRWDQLLPLGMLDPHDSISHSAGIADAQAEGAAVLPPERFTNFAVPKLGDTDSQQEVVTLANPFNLPKAYLHAQQQRTKAVESLKQTLKGVALEESRKRDLTTAIHAYFKEWLYSTGNIRQIYDLQVLERDPKAMD
jgi:TBCC domain-containing protein 1